MTRNEDSHVLCGQVVSAATKAVDNNIYIFSGKQHSDDRLLGFVFSVGRAPIKHQHDNVHNTYIIYIYL